MIKILQKKKKKKSMKGLFFGKVEGSVFETLLKMNPWTGIF